MEATKQQFNRGGKLPGPTIILYTASQEEKNAIETLAKAMGSKVSPFILNMVRYAVKLHERKAGKEVATAA